MDQNELELCRSILKKLQYMSLIVHRKAGDYQLLLQNKEHKDYGNVGDKTIHLVNLLEQNCQLIKRKLQPRNSTDPVLKVDETNHDKIKTEVEVQPKKDDTSMNFQRGRSLTPKKKNSDLRKSATSTVVAVESSKLDVLNRMRDDSNENTSEDSKVVEGNNEKEEREVKEQPENNKSSMDFRRVWSVTPKKKKSDLSKSATVDGTAEKSDKLDTPNPIRGDSNENRFLDNKVQRTEDDEADSDSSLDFPLLLSQTPKKVSFNIPQGEIKDDILERIDVLKEENDQGAKDDERSSELNSSLEFPLFFSQTPKKVSFNIPQAEMEDDILKRINDLKEEDNDENEDNMTRNNENHTHNPLLNPSPQTQSQTEKENFDGPKIEISDDIHESNGMDVDSTNIDKQGDFHKINSHEENTMDDIYNEELVKQLSEVINASSSTDFSSIEYKKKDFQPLREELDSEQSGIYNQNNKSELLHNENTNIYSRGLQENVMSDSQQTEIYSCRDTDTDDTDSVADTLIMDSEDDNDIDLEEFYKIRYDVKDCSVLLERMENSACINQIDDRESKDSQVTINNSDSEEDREIARLCQLTNLDNRKIDKNEKVYMKQIQSDDTSEFNESSELQSSLTEDTTFDDFELPSENGFVESNEYLAFIVADSIQEDCDESYSSQDNSENIDKNSKKKANKLSAKKTWKSESTNLQNDCWRKDPLLTCKINLDNKNDTKMIEDKSRIPLNNKNNSNSLSKENKLKDESDNEERWLNGSDLSDVEEVDISDLSDEEKDQLESTEQANNYINEGSNTNAETVAVSPDEKSVTMTETILEQSVKTKKGRRNIKPLLTYEELTEATKRAEKEEKQRSCRIKKRQEFLKSQATQEDELILDSTKGGEKIEVDPGLCKKLFPHQREGVSFMWKACYESVERLQAHDGSGCILAHCMGLGKTFQVVTLIHTLISYPVTQTKHVLVICPVSTVLAWINEIKSGLETATKEIDINVEHIEGTDSIVSKCLKIKKWRDNTGILVMGYEAFVHLIFGKYVVEQIEKELWEALLDPGPDLVICDEGHLLKNDKTQRTKALSKIRTSRRIILTGTPMQNNLKEYYYMVNYVNPDRLGTFKEYSNRFVIPITNGQYVDSTKSDIMLMKKRSHVLHKLLKNTVQRYEVKELNKYLKPIKNYTIFTQLHPVQASLYGYYMKKAKQHFLLLKKNKGTNLFADMNIAKYISSHPYMLSIMEEEIKSKKNKKELFSNGEEDVLKVRHIEKDWWKKFCSAKDLTDIDCGPKLKLALAIIEEAETIGDKILIFTPSLIELDAIEYFLNNVGTTHCKTWKHGTDYFRMDGSVSFTRRGKMCNIYNNTANKTMRLFLLSYKVGGLGLTLTAANRVILLGSIFNPVYDTQSIYRCYRFGQSKTVYVYRLISLGTMEEKIYRRCVSKLALACRVVDKHQIDRHYDMSEIEQLYADDIDLNLPKPTPAMPDDHILATLILKFDFIHKYLDHQGLLENRPEDDLNDEDEEKAWEEFKRECQLQTVHKPTVSDLSATDPASATYNPASTSSIKTPADSSEQPNTENLDTSCSLPATADCSEFLNNLAFHQIIQLIKEGYGNSAADNSNPKNGKIVNTPQIKLDNLTLTGNPTQKIPITGNTHNTPQLLVYSTMNTAASKKYQKSVDKSNELGPTAETILKRSANTDYPAQLKKACIDIPVSKSGEKIGSPTSHTDHNKISKIGDVLIRRKCSTENSKTLKHSNVNVNKYPTEIGPSDTVIANINKNFTNIYNDVGLVNSTNVNRGESFKDQVIIDRDISNKKTFIPKIATQIMNNIESKKNCSLEKPMCDDVRLSVQKYQQVCKNTGTSIVTDTEKKKVLMDSNNIIEANSQLTFLTSSKVLMQQMKGSVLKQLHKLNKPPAIVPVQTVPTGRTADKPANVIVRGDNSSDQRFLPPKGKSATNFAVSPRIIKVPHTRQIFVPIKTSTKSQNTLKRKHFKNEISPDFPLDLRKRMKMDATKHVEPSKSTEVSKKIEIPRTPIQIVVNRDGIHYRGNQETSSTSSQVTVNSNSTKSETNRPHLSKLNVDNKIIQNQEKQVIGHHTHQKKDNTTSCSSHNAINNPQLFKSNDYNLILQYRGKQKTVRQTQKEKDNTNSKSNCSTVDNLLSFKKNDSLKEIVHYSGKQETVGQMPRGKYNFKSLRTINNPQPSKQNDYCENVFQYPGKQLTVRQTREKRNNTKNDISSNEMISPQPVEQNDSNIKVMQCRGHQESLRQNLQIRNNTESDLSSKIILKQLGTLSSSADVSVIMMPNTKVEKPVRLYETVKKSSI